MNDSYEFLWSDKYKYRKPARLSAKKYIDTLMNWTVHLLEDETLFPVTPGTGCAAGVISRYAIS